MLDLEKAYDGVDWNFLCDTLPQFEFQSVKISPVMSKFSTTLVSYYGLRV